MNQSGAATATAPTGDYLGSEALAPLNGIEYLDAWRAAVRPLPGSVPPFAGFSPTNPNDPVRENDVVGATIAAAIASITSAGTGIAALAAVDPADLNADVLAQMVEGTEQLRRMIDAATLMRDAGMLLDDAINLPYTEFERNLRTWEALADPAGDDTRNERARAHREFNLHPRPDGGWNLTGFLPEPAGIEFAEIFAWYVEAEWKLDWADARNRLGDQATQTDLARTEAQRRADALLTMARASVSRDPNVARPTTSAVTVDILLDHHTMEAHAIGTTPDPRRFRNVISRTQSGRRLHPNDAINAALVNHIRRAVYDSSGTVIELGRRSRLFRGPARDAVMLLLTTCVWIGCDQPVAWCDADHSLS